MSKREEAERQLREVENDRVVLICGLRECINAGTSAQWNDAFAAVRMRYYEAKEAVAKLDREERDALHAAWVEFRDHIEREGNLAQALFDGVHGKRAEGERWETEQRLLMCNALGNTFLAIEKKYGIEIPKGKT